MVKARLGLALVVAIAATAGGARPAIAGVAEIQSEHDRGLIGELKAYLDQHPKADDAEQAFMTIFNKTIEHDWFVEHEAVARRYLAERADGPLHSLARIVMTMARAQSGQFTEALARYNELIRGLGKAEQEEFAVNFSDTLATAASAAGEYQVARRVYETLLERFGDSPAVRQKVRDDLHRLDKVGRPAPTIAVQDIKGNSFRLSDLKGRYVLVDFWATWCNPCVAELPKVQAAYARYRAEGLEVVAVSLDETKAPLVEFVRTRNIPWRQIHNATSGGDLVEAFGVNTIPATFLIDPEGTVVRMELRGPALEKTLAKYLKGNPGGGPGVAPPSR